MSKNNSALTIAIQLNLNDLVEWLLNEFHLLLNHHETKPMMTYHDNNSQRDLTFLLLFSICIVCVTYPLASFNYSRFPSSQPMKVLTGRAPRAIPLLYYSIHI